MAKAKEPIGEEGVIIVATIKLARSQANSSKPWPNIAIGAGKRGYIRQLELGRWAFKHILSDNFKLEREDT